jgi:hypothetical protein
MSHPKRQAAPPVQLSFGVKRVILEPRVFNRVVDIVSVLNLLSVRFLLVFTGAFTFVACSSNAIRILYDSEPQGAMITAVDSIAALGRAPVVKAYNLDTLPAPDENGCIIIPGVEALWDSGATARIGGLRICDLEQNTFSIRLPRPSGYPDLDVDLEVAIEQGRKLSIERDRRVYGGVEPPRSNPTGIR